MAAQPQTFENHAKVVPAYHYFTFGLIAVYFFYRLYELITAPSLANVMGLVAATALLMVFFWARIFALKVQDRVIRLEERLRLAQLLPEPLRSRIGDLTEAQFIGLRFASDAEVAPLVEKALSGMTRGEIKKAISNWRPDYFRV